jgi:hypothetical protein
MTVKLDYFDYDFIENYYIDNLTNKDFWVYLSHGSDTIIPRSTNSAKNAMEFLEKAIGAVRCNPKDFAFMIPIRFWAQNEVYVEYDDQTNLKDQPFFIAVEPEVESGNYHIFKCISNNYGAPSAEKPSFNQSIQSGLYEGGDGYIWKYMTSVPALEYRKFAARGFMPIFRNKSVEDISNEGIYNIKVENRESNFGYELLNGEIESIDIEDSTITISAIRRLSGSDGTLSVNQAFDFQIEDFYSNRNFRINSAISNFLIGSKSFTIIGSGVNENGRRFFKLDSVEGITEGDPFEITPRIDIRGDGSGARAIPIFEDERITSIRILSFGDNYKNAVARALPPALGFDPTQGAIEVQLRPIVSPVGGHGKNVVRELISNAISISVLVSSGQGSELPSQGTYSKIGLVKNPEFSPAAVFTRKNALESQENTNSITMTNVNNLEVGIRVSFEDSIPLKTTIIGIDPIANVITLSANIEVRIPQNSNIVFSKVLDTFDNRLELICDNVPSGLEVGEIVTQGDASGRIHSFGKIEINNIEYDVIYLVDYNGPFSDIFTTQPLITRLGSIGINSIKYAPYIQKTGNVLYTSDITPIIRSDEDVEQLRIVINF